MKNLVILSIFLVVSVLHAQEFKIHLDNFEVKGKVKAIESTTSEVGIDPTIEKNGKPAYILQAKETIKATFNSKGYAENVTKFDKYGYFETQYFKFSPKLDEVKVLQESHRENSDGEIEDLIKHIATYKIYRVGKEWIFDRKDKPSVKRDAKGKIVAYKMCNLDAPPSCTPVEISYKNNQLFKKTIYPEMLASIIIEEYNKDGLLTYRNVFNDEFFVTYRNGLLIEKVEYEDENRKYFYYDYVFDDLGNWFIKVEYQRNQWQNEWFPMNITQRTITYFDGKKTDADKWVSTKIDELLSRSVSIPVKDLDPKAERN